jgi:hypothetical protein
MIIKLEQIINGVESLKELQEVKLPVKISYRIARLVVKLQPELTVYENKRNELIKELGTEQENGDFKITDPEKLKTFTEKMKELWDMEVEIDWELLKIDDLGDIVVAPKLLNLFIFSE